MRKTRSYCHHRRHHQFSWVTIQWIIQDSKVHHKSLEKVAFLYHQLHISDRIFTKTKLNLQLRRVDRHSKAIMDVITLKASTWKCPTRTMTRCLISKVIFYCSSNLKTAPKHNFTVAHFIHLTVPPFVHNTIYWTIHKIQYPQHHSITDKTSDELHQQLNTDSLSNSLIGPPPSLFASPIDPTKRSNPFRSGTQDVFNQLQPPLLMHPNAAIRAMAPPRPLLEIPTAFSSGAPFMSHGALPPELDANSANQPHNPFALNSPRSLTPHLNAPQMNYRTASPPVRNGTPYFRGQNSPMRGNFRPNFRGGNMRGSW